MDIGKEQKLSEVLENVSVSNEDSTHHNKGERSMKTTSQTSNLETINDLVSRFGGSTLRKERYQFMKTFLKLNGSVPLRKSYGVTLFRDWTPEQVQQALDDVLYFKNGRAEWFYGLGDCLIKYCEPDSKEG